MLLSAEISIFGNFWTLNSEHFLNTVQNLGVLFRNQILNTFWTLFRIFGVQKMLLSAEISTFGIFWTPNSEHFLNTVQNFGFFVQKTCFFDAVAPFGQAGVSIHAKLMKQEVRVGGRGSAESSSQGGLPGIFELLFLSPPLFHFFYFSFYMSFLCNCVRFHFFLFICLCLSVLTSLLLQNSVFSLSLLFLSHFSICLILYLCLSSRLCFFYLPLFSQASFLSSILPVGVLPCFPLFMSSPLLCLLH